MQIIVAVTSVGLLGAVAVVPVADALAHLVEQPRCLRRRQFCAP